MKKFTIAFFVILFLSINIQAQEINFKTFTTDDFSLSYPENWKTQGEGKVYNFYLDIELGDISISVYKNSNFSDEKIEGALLGINEKRSDTDKVEKKIKDGTTEYMYTYTQNGIKWIGKGIRKGVDFYFITLNWKLTSWDSYSKQFTKTFDSFSIK